MRRLRVGVIGCGLIAQLAHLPYLRELSHLFEISALCATSPDRVEQLGDRYNVPGRFVDYQDLLEQDLDAVLILTRDHADIAVAAANRGLHIFVEKPLCFNLEEADHMIDSARRYGVKLMVGYMKRYDPGFERAWEIFRQMEGEKLIRVHSSIGDPSRMTRQMYDIIPSSDASGAKRAAPGGTAVGSVDAGAADAGGTPAGAAARSAVRTAGGVGEKDRMLQAIGLEREHLVGAYSLLLHVWSHDVNVLRSCFGEPRHIRYSEVRAGSMPVQQLPAVQVLAVLDFDPGTAGVWETKAFAANERWDEELAVFGETKTVRVRFPFPYVKNVPAIVRVEETERGELISKEILSSCDEAYKRELRHFYDCIVRDKQPLTDGDDGKKDVAFAIQLIRKATSIGRKHVSTS